MKLAVLSGKGGAGKTLVAVNLALAAGQSVYVDCDVEEPNGRLFWKPRNVREQEVATLLPAFDAEACNGCRKCVDFCRFNALLYIKKKPMVFSEVCHSCGGCMLVCPQGAITEEPKPVGHLEIGTHGSVTVVTGVLNPGEGSGVPVIQAALKQGEQEPGPMIIDCPPGSACSVMESVTGADYCVLVAEPTAFGLHNFRMVWELVTLLHKPCGVVINKMETPYEPLERFCREQNLEILDRLPYEERAAAHIARGDILGETEGDWNKRFRDILEKIGGGRS